MDKKFLRNLAFKTIIYKKSRSLLSILSTMISTAIIVLSMLLFTFVVNITNQSGQVMDDYHYEIVTQDEVDLPSRYLVWKESSMDENSICGFETTNQYCPFNVVEGVLPTSANEMLAPNSKYSLNDQVNGYKVVGIYESENADGLYVPSNDNHHEKVYVKDTLIHMTGSDDELISNYKNVVRNIALIQSDKIENLFESKSFFLITFVFVILLCLVMSFICVKNIFIITDQYRKKEIGLLKSVGSDIKGIKYYLKTELIVLGVIGALIGAGIGFGLSFGIKSVICERISLTYVLVNGLDYLVLVCGTILGFGIFVLSGWHANMPYFKTMAIEDLKETNLEFDQKNEKPIKDSHSFSWRMFLIYNRRMKKQTRNLLVSFMLLLMTSILFSSVFLVNLIYRNNYIKVNMMSFWKVKAIRTTNF